MLHSGLSCQRHHPDQYCPAVAPIPVAARTIPQYARPLMILPPVSHHRTAQRRPDSIFCLCCGLDGTSCFHLVTQAGKGTIHVSWTIDVGRSAVDERERRERVDTCAFWCNVSSEHMADRIIPRQLVGRNDRDHGHVWQPRPMCMLAWRARLPWPRDQVWSVPHGSGQRWLGVTDAGSTSRTAIRAITVHPQQPEVVFVGTQEGRIRPPTTVNTGKR